MEIKWHSKYIPWIKRSILVAGIIPMVALTINDLVPLMKDYNDSEKNVLTQVSVEMNRSIPRPNITVCVPYYSNALGTIEKWLINRGSDPNLTPPEAFTSMKTHSWNDIWDMNVTIFNESDSDEGVAKIVKRIIMMNEEDQLATLYGNKSLHWNQPIIDAFWRYLVLVISLDKFLTPPYPPDGRTLSDKTFPMQTLLTTVGQVSNKQMDQLFKRVLQAILPRYYFESNQNLPSASTAVLDDAVDFCFQPSTTDVEVDSVGTAFLFLFRSNISGPLRIFEEPSILYSSSADQNYFQLYEKYVVDAAGIISGRVEMPYSIEFRFIENRTDHICSNDISPALCLANHQVNVTIEHCQCIPFAYRFLRDNLDNLSYCHLIHYKSCSEKLVESAKKNTDFCSRNCEYTFYRWNPPAIVSRDTVVDADSTPIYPIVITPFDLIIYPFQRAPYLEVKITDKINLHEFFSQLGGSIGFYLGFSCLTGFGIIGLLVEYIIKRYEARKSPDTTENGTNPVWTFLWTKNFINILAGRAEDDNKKRKMEGICEELNELKKENSQLRNLIDQKGMENEKHDQIRDQKMDDMEKKMGDMDKKMDYMDKKTDEMAKKMDNMDRRMENLSKEFMQQSELMMKMLVQLKNDTETSKQQTQ